MLQFLRSLSHVLPGVSQFQQPSDTALFFSLVSDWISVSLSVIQYQFISEKNQGNSTFTWQNVGNILVHISYLWERIIQWLLQRQLRICSNYFYCPAAARDLSHTSWSIIPCLSKLVNFIFFWGVWSMGSFTFQSIGCINFKLNISS